jgi:hypothetical protein
MNPDVEKPTRAGRWPGLVLGTVLALGLLPAFILWEHVRLPFHNPWNVVGPLTKEQFNPNNNIVRFAMLLACPLFLILGLHFFARGRLGDLVFGPALESNPEPFGPPTPRGWSDLLLGCILILALNIPSYLTTGLLDSHHEGESLGTAVSYLHGQAPYRDFVFVHGVYDDPVRSALAFKLFGKSIGAARTLQSIHKLVVYALLGLFLLHLFRGRAVYAGLAFLVLLICQSQPFLAILPVTIPPRDIITFAFLLTVGALARVLEGQDARAGRLLPPAFLLGFWPVLGFWYSVDRGFYLSATFVVVLALVLLLLPGRSLRGLFVLGSAAGGGVGILVGLAILRGGMAAFVEFVFVVMPRYKELMDGYVFHVFEMPYLLATLLVAVNTFWVFRLFLCHVRAAGNRFLPGLREFARADLLTITLAALGVFFFRSALGRADITHLAYVTSPSVILFVYLVARSVLAPTLARPTAFRLARTGFLTAVVVLAVAGLVRVAAGGLLVWNFPYNVPDDEFIADDYKGLIRFLRSHLEDGDDFFAMTPEASWYYFLDRPSPTRFPVVWFAAPDFYQEEVVQELENHHVLYVLYRNKTSKMSDMDMQTRMPIIDRYLRRHYRPYRNFDHNELWVRKDFPADDVDGVAAHRIR